MKMQYFPGCTLKNKAKQLDINARQCAEVHGVTLEEPKEWQCCGGYVTVVSPEQAEKNSRKLCDNAIACGADMIVTACPLCKYNLDRQGCPIPVVYFTELLAEALGIAEAFGVKEDGHAE